MKTGPLQKNLRMRSTLTIQQERSYNLGCSNPKYVSRGGDPLVILPDSRRRNKDNFRVWSPEAPTVVEKQTRYPDATSNIDNLNIPKISKTLRPGQRLS
jgi:hypothetical protein